MQVLRVIARCGIVVVLIANLGCKSTARHPSDPLFLKRPPVVRTEISNGFPNPRTDVPRAPTVPRGVLQATEKKPSSPNVNFVSSPSSDGTALGFQRVILLEPTR